MLKLEEVLRVLPPFLEVFFIGINDTKMSATKLSYANDIKIFFDYLTENIDIFKNLDNFTINEFKLIDAFHIEKYLKHLSYYTKTVKERVVIRQNEAQGKSKKLAAIRTMFKYFYKKRLIDSDPSVLVDFPKVHKKQIVRLEVDEVASLLDEVESGANLRTARHKLYHDRLKLRDLALVTLLLGTGMRISECVGIDLNHLDFSINAVKITRKGGKTDIVYFGTEVRHALMDYIKQRELQEALPDHEFALFLSAHKKRLSVRACEILVKKYAKLVTPLKNITPHKFRSTYGTNLYNETGDAFLVATVLGHEDINTTTKNYIAMDVDKKRQAAKAVILRDDLTD